jgi:UDP-glucose 4-epimerase
MEYVENKFGWKPKISLQEGMRRVFDKAVERLRNEKK